MSVFPHPLFFRILDKQNDMEALAAELETLETSYRNLEATNQVRTSGVIENEVIADFFSVFYLKTILFLKRFLLFRLSVS